MPIENRMRKPSAYIAWNGVLNCACIFVLAIFAVTGFYGYLSLGDDVKDTATLNLPNTVSVIASDFDILKNHVN